MSDWSEHDAAPRRTPGAPCPGICNRAFRRADAAYKADVAAYSAALDNGEPGEQPEYHGVVPEKGEPVWCPGCRDTIRSGIVKLPALAVQLAARRDGRLIAVSRAERHGTPGGSPSGSPAWDAFDEVVQWACGWEDAVRQLFGHQPARLPSWTPERGKALTAACRYLDGWHTQVLADDTIGYDFGHELLALARRMEKLAGLSGSVTRLRAPCRRCDLVGYQQQDGSEIVECRHCHDRMTMDHYDTWSKMAAAAIKDTA